MSQSVNVTELRQHLPAYLKQVEDGAEIAVTLHGRVIARLIPGADEDPRAGALRRLEALRGRMVLGDVEAPLTEAWSGDDDHL